MMKVNTSVSTSYTSNLAQIPLCPDGLKYEHLGAADNLRGKVVKAFFWLIRWWD